MPHVALVSPFEEACFRKLLHTNLPYCICTLDYVFITLTEFYCVRKISDISSLYNRSKHPDLQFRTNLVCMAFLGIWVGNTLVLHPNVQFASTPIHQQNGEFVLQHTHLSTEHDCVLQLAITF